MYKAEYEYDLRGMVTNIVEQYGEGAGERRNLEYDVLGRLVREEFGAFEVAYEYDRLGNRILQTHPNEQQAYHYNSRNELLRLDLPGRTRYLSYDLNGSLTQKVDAAVSISYDWDSRGRLKQVRTNDVEVFRADYAGGLNRLRKTEGGDSKVYRHDGSTAIQEVDEAGSVKELVRADRGASAVGGVLYSADAEGTNTYTYNGVGSTVVLSENDGTARNVKYDSFGNILETDEGVDLERLANTKELDQSTGLYYHGARYYDAQIGRYISMDPLRDGANFYVYANNAPLTYVDPTGLSAEGMKPNFWQVIAEGLRKVWDNAVGMGLNSALEPVACGPNGGLGICEGPMYMDIQGWKRANVERPEHTGEKHLRPIAPKSLGKPMKTQLRILDSMESINAHKDYLVQAFHHMSPKVRAEAQEALTTAIRNGGRGVLLGMNPMKTDPQNGYRPESYIMAPPEYQPHGLLVYSEDHKIQFSLFGNDVSQFGMPPELVGNNFITVQAFPVEKTRQAIGRYAYPQKTVPWSGSAHPFLIGLERSVRDLGTHGGIEGKQGGTALIMPKRTSIVFLPGETGVQIPANFKAGNAYVVTDPKMLFNAIVVGSCDRPTGTSTRDGPFRLTGIDPSFLDLVK